MEPQAIVAFLNRFIIPQLNMANEAIIGGTGGEYVVPFGPSAYKPSAGTSASFQTAGTMVTTLNTARAILDKSDFPDVDGRAASFYVQVSGYMSAATADSVEFELYDVTNGASLGTVLSTTETAPDYGEIGPLNLESGSVEYSIRSKRTGGTTEEAYMVHAAFLVRYE